MRGTPREVYALLSEWQAAPQEPEPLVIETSGSTGTPKHVVLSRRAMRASATATALRLGGPGQWLLNLPATYVAGVQVLFRSLLSGIDPVVLEEHADFAAATDAMTGWRRYVSLVPTQLTRMLASPRDVEALRTFDTVLVGGAAVEPALRRAAAAEDVHVVATYGMSETCGGCVYDGVPLDGVAVKVGGDGRVRIGGPVLFDRYDGQPGLTAEVMEDGWFLTSDLGRLDDDGRLQVLGRADDVVVSGGVKVPGPAVARRLREHPRIQAAEVVGVPEPAEVGGEEPAVLHHLRGQPRLPVVPVEEHRAADPDAPVAAHLDRDPVERDPVVDAAAAGLAHPVRRDDVHVLGGRGPSQGGLHRGAADQDGVERAQRLDVARRGEHPGQLGRDQRDVAPPAGHRVGGGREVGVLLEHHRVDAGQQRAEEHLDPGDVRRRAGSAATGRARRAAGRSRSRRPASRGGRGRRAWACRSSRRSR